MDLAKYRLVQAILGIGMPRGWYRGEMATLKGETPSAYSVYKVLGRGVDSDHLRVMWFHEENGVIAPFSVREFNIRDGRALTPVEKTRFSIGVGRRK